MCIRDSAADVLLLTLPVFARMSVRSSVIALPCLVPVSVVRPPRDSERPSPSVSWELGFEEQMQWGWGCALPLHMGHTLSGQV